MKTRMTVSRKDERKMTLTKELCILLNLNTIKTMQSRSKSVPNVINIHESNVGSSAHNAFNIHEA